MLSRTMSKLLFYGFLVTFGAMSWAQDSSVSIKAIEKNVKRAMKTFDVPGVALAIVKDDEVLLSRGFGVTKLGSKKKVNGDTLFGIASNTKAFTAAALAILVDEGKLRWDDKVVDLLPGFKLNDPYVTAHLTVRDMLSHRSGLGLGAGDLMIWPTSTTSKAQLMEGLQYIKPVSSMRSKYAYNNMMYVMAGEVVAQVSGMSWEAFVRTRILKPLKMYDTRMKFSRIGKDNRNVASPHSPVDGKLTVVGGNFLENFKAAGSMASNVNDMSKWVRMQLRGGRLSSDESSDERLFSSQQQAQMWHPNIMRMVGEFDKAHFNTHFRGYGLGWGVNDHHGYKVVSHTGGILGMVSRVVLVPELQLGIVALTNQQSGAAFMAITNDIISRFDGSEAKDWVDIYHKRLVSRQEKTKAALKSVMAARDADSKPSLALQSYAQTYTDPWYGDVDVTLNTRTGQLNIQFGRTPELKGHLEHYQYDTFIVRWQDRAFDADAFITFVLNAEGEVAQATMKAVSGTTDFSFDFHDLLLQPK